jgi:hypothetical protein
VEKRAARNKAGSDEPVKRALASWGNAAKEVKRKKWKVRAGG